MLQVTYSVPRVSSTRPEVGTMELRSCSDCSVFSGRYVINTSRYPFVTLLNVNPRIDDCKYTNQISSEQQSNFEIGL